MADVLSAVIGRGLQIQPFCAGERAGPDGSEQESTAVRLAVRSALAGTLLAFGTYFIGFVGRPIGAAIFGDHLGDRIGRKATLIATLLGMGLATFAIAFVAHLRVHRKHLGARCF